MEAEEIESNALEIARCGASFIHFLSYCKVVTAPARDNPGGVIPFQLWPHILKAVKALLSRNLIVWLKSRQIGASWLIAAYVLWYALFKHGAVVILFSKGQPEAVELLGKAKRIFNHLPDFLRLKTDKFSDSEVTFPSMESSIQALASTENAGIGYSASIIVCDEWEQHPYAVANFMQAKPCIDSSGGQFIGVFTRDKRKKDPLATRTFIDAMAGKTDFFALFDPYDVVPGRDETWYEQKVKELSPDDLEGLTPELYMQQNYPRSISEALRVPSSISAFNYDVLDQMAEETRNPLRNVEGAEDMDSNIVHIWKPYHIGGRYIASTDASHGVGQDFSVTVVMDIRTGEVVADICRRDLTPRELASHSVKLLNYYHKPLWYPENNDWGHEVIMAALDLGYKHFGYENDKKVDGREGIRTTPSTRIEIYGAVIPAVNNHQVIIYGKEGLKQFYDVIRNPEKSGRIEARRGGNDDYPVAVGICLAKMHNVILTPQSYAPIRSLHFTGAMR